FQVPMSPTSLSAYPLGEPPGAAPVGHSWADVSAAFETARAIVHVPSGERLVLLFGDDTPLAPRVVETTGAPRVAVAGEDRRLSAQHEPGGGRPPGPQAELHT